MLLLWSWLVLSLAQGYYSMMLFPFLMTVVLPNSLIRNWPAWLADLRLHDAGPLAAVPLDEVRAAPWNT